jgi:hypothetical protein
MLPASKNLVLICQESVEGLRSDLTDGDSQTGTINFEGGFFLYDVSHKSSIAIVEIANNKECRSD